MEKWRRGEVGFAVGGRFLDMNCLVFCLTCDGPRGMINGTAPKDRDLRCDAAAGEENGWSFGGD